MNSAFKLAWRYLAYHRSRTLLLVFALTLTCVLPLTAHLLVRAFTQRMLARAQSTPLVLGARGDRFNLVLKALYFSAAEIGTLTMADVAELAEGELADVIPLHLRYTANGHPLVGTSLEYFDLRGLRPAAGAFPLRLGQAVLGAQAASALRLQPGDALLTDQRSLYDISAAYPLKLQVSGVLGRTGTVDDDAIFIDVKTAWIVDGISHGHTDVTRPDADPTIILSREPGVVKTNAAVVEYNEVTADNIASFHVHAEPDQLPLSAIIVLPHDAKSATLLKARYARSETRVLLEPGAVVRELAELVFRVQRFFDANFALVAIAAMLFLALIVVLSRQLRRREMETMRRIGCQPGMTVRIQLAELAIVLIMSAALSGGVALLALSLAPHAVRFM